VAEWRQTIESAGVKVLHNESTVLELKGRRVVIAGVGDPSCGWDDLPQALSGNPSGEVHLMLVHSPDLLDEPATDWADLVLCGHTHGGQMTLPGIGSPWAPVWRDRRRSEGLIKVGEALCYVSRGVGAGIRTRFRCPPEVCQLTLTAGAADNPRVLPRFNLATRPEPGRLPQEQRQEA
jgi:uncharacterized protein